MIQMQSLLLGTPVASRSVTAYNPLPGNVVFIVKPVYVSRPLLKTVTNKMSEFGPPHVTPAVTSPGNLITPKIVPVL